MTALLEKPMMRVSPLKAGLSSRTKASTNPVTVVDPNGLLPRQWGQFTIVGGSDREIKCVHKLLEAINNSPLGECMLGRIKSATIRFDEPYVAGGNNPVPEVSTEHGDKLIRLPQLAHWTDHLPAVTIMTFPIPENMDEGWRKASPLRALLHELAHLSFCENSDNECKSKGRSCADEYKTSSEENRILMEINTQKSLNLLEHVPLPEQVGLDAWQQKRPGYMNAPMEDTGSLDC